MDAKFVVDLSQKLISKGEYNFEFELQLPDATESMPLLTHDDDVWYKIGRVNMCTHNGTHVEVPYHHLKDGLHLANFPINQLIGNLVLLEFSYKKPTEMIKLEEVKAYDDQIHEGDIVFIRTSQDKGFRGEHWIDYPYVQVEALRWLVDKKIGCLGTDSAGIEDIYAHNQPGHVTLFLGNIPLVESLTNLDQVKTGKYVVFILPLPIEYGDASPVRVVAVRQDGLSSLLGK
jgi:arylformamidase